MTKPLDIITQEKSADTNKRQRTLDELKTDATGQLKKILAQGKNIQNFQSNMDLIIKRYHTDDSFLDNLANSYSELLWWIKLGILASVVSIAACIGIACNLVIVLCVVTFILYSVFALILESHHAAVLKRDNRLATDIVELEESLAESVQHINEIEESLQSVLTSLCDMNLQQAQDIEAFQAHINELGTQMNRLIEINHRLDSTKDILVSSTEKMGEAFAEAQASLNELTNSLSNNSSQLDTTEQALFKSATKLMNDHNSLQQISTSFDENHTALSNMTEDLGGLLGKLKTQAAATEVFHEAAIEKLSRSIDKTLTTTLDTNELISKADITIDDAVKLLDTYKADKTKTDSDETRRNADMKQRAKTANAALERAASILAAQKNRGPSGFIASYVPLMQ